MRRDLPGILSVNVIFLRLERAFTRRAERQQRTVRIEDEIAGVLREPADDRSHGVLHAHSRTLNRELRVDWIRDAGAATLEERRVGDRVVKRTGKRSARVADQTNVCAEAQAVI